MVRREEILYRGKAKSVYRTRDPGIFLMEFRDDITAFDGKKKDVLSRKGAYNCCVSAFFFRMLESKGIQTHFVRSLDSTSLLVQALSMIPLEIIVRNRAAGSIVRNLPFQEGQLLDPPVIVIALKDDARHDPMINEDLAVALKLATGEELQQMKEMALRVNDVLTTHLEKQGILLVDFKLEFGRRDGEILLGDEISMDSMRLWDITTAHSLDKDVYRFDKGDVLETYRAVAQRITGGECEV